MPAADDAVTTACSSLASLLSAWQSSGDARDFESLLAAARPLMERTASCTLRRHHVNDPMAVDDAVSLVLDHLRRLPTVSHGDRLVARFALQTPAEGVAMPGDGGQAYLIWLVRSRALDVARRRRRGSHRISCFSELSPETTKHLAAHAADGPCEAPLAVMCCRLHDAIQLLEPRERTVIDMLLDGKTQVVIAHALYACEGTVSRLRSRAIAALRVLLAE